MFYCLGRREQVWRCGEMAERTKALAWRASRRAKPCLVGSNPTLSANLVISLQSSVVGEQGGGIRVSEFLQEGPTTDV